MKRRLESGFRDTGMPSFLLSDRGPPFGFRGIGRLSRLGVWLVRSGDQPIFIQPGHPEQNGRHEQFHEALMAETAKHPRASVSAKQVAFNRFRTCYNEERPHEALDVRTPSELYERSSRSMPHPSSEHESAGGYEVRRVRRDGTMEWGGRSTLVGEAMAGELIGDEPRR